jgi:hypothetical protein
MQSYDVVLFYTNGMPGLKNPNYPKIKREEKKETKNTIGRTFQSGFPLPSAHPSGGANGYA